MLLLKFLYYPVKLGFAATSGGSDSGAGDADFANVQFYDLNDSFVYFDVLLPHVLDVIVVLALFLVWFPRPEFSHVDTEVGSSAMMCARGEGGELSCVPS